MDIENWECAGSLPLLYQELQQLGLETNVAELEAFGFTIIPPEKVGPPDYHIEIREALERVVERRFGEDISRWNNVNDNMRFLLWEDPVFEKMTYNPAGLGLAQYLLGTNCILSLCNGWVKGPGEARTGIHGDYLDPGPDAQPGINVNANVHYFLTDYNKADGAISFLPGSHRWRRQVSPPESKYWADRAHPVTAPAGSAVVWGNHTWHGSYPRQTPGVRMALQCEYMRPRYQPQEPYRDTVTQTALDRNPVRFAGLMDVYGPFPFGKSDRILEREISAPPGTGHGRGTPDRYCSLFDVTPAAGRTTLRPQYDYFDHDGRMSTDRRTEIIQKRKEMAEKQQAKVTE
jgi:ectoine hydroxylase-related dioxygenase (phytanoyl-CoA dioxygenase family)